LTASFYYDAELDKKLREEIQKDRARIINLMILAKKGGEPTQKPERKEKKEYSCHEEWEKQE
jgi:hypothetical protein